LITKSIIVLIIGAISIILFSAFLNTLLYYCNEILFDKFAVIVNQITKCF